jgi:kinesin family member 1
LTNLNEDQMLSNVIVHFIKDQDTTIGRSESCDIKLTGLSIEPQHAVIKYDKKSRKALLSLAEDGALLRVNGVTLTQEIELEDNDRVLFGSNLLYVFRNPKKTNKNSKVKVTYEMARKEIAEASGYSTSNNSSLTKEQIDIQEEIIDLLPMINEVNAISDELDKYKVFEIILMPSIVFDENVKKQKQRVIIRMTNLQNQNVWLWDKNKFISRRFLMQELYQKFTDGENMFFKNMKKEDDPFWEPVEDLFIGLSHFCLSSLPYAMDFEDKAFISDYKVNN